MIWRLFADARPAGRVLAALGLAIAFLNWWIFWYVDVVPMIYLNLAVSALGIWSAYDALIVGRRGEEMGKGGDSFGSYYDRAGQQISLESWAALHSGMSYKRVNETQIGPYWVSTVWLGINHGFGSGPPLIFETMVFANTDETLGPDLECRRYSTEAEARAGHDETVLLVEATYVPLPDQSEEDADAERRD